jgi:hypothetical protein
VSYAIGGILAAIFGFLELHSRLDSRPTRRAGANRWWTLLLLLEGLSGVAVAAGLDVGSGASTGVLAGLGSGLAGPAATRLRFVTVGKGESAQPIGLATLIDPLRAELERRIDQCGAAEQTRWINGDVRPAIRDAHLTPQEVADWLGGYITSSISLPPSERIAEVKFLQATADDATSYEKKIRTMVLRACYLGAYKAIDKLLEEAQRRKSEMDPSGGAQQDDVTDEEAS